MSESKTILERWGITMRELTQLVDENPSLRGIMLGYVAELKLTQLLAASAEISESAKHDDHDRAGKGDRVVRYKGRQFLIESKSLQTNSVSRQGDEWTGQAQVDASDRRTVILPNGRKLETTLLLIGEFDILAVNCFAFENKWRWLFCKNADLPRSTYRKYTKAQRQHLLASLVTVTWPPRPPFTENIFEVLDELVNERAATGGSRSAPP